MSLEAKYIYPPNWDGNFDGKIGPKRYVLNITGEQEAGQEDEIDRIRIVDISEMICTDGQTPDRMVIEKVEWTVTGGVCALWFDRDPERHLITMADHGKLHGPIIDPSEAGSLTGDLMFTNSAAWFNVTIRYGLKHDKAY